MSEWQQAIKTWNELLEINPRNDNILARIGDIYMTIDNEDEARRCYHRVLARSRNKYALLGLNKILRKGGEFDKAIRNYKLILTSDPHEDRALQGIKDTEAEAEKAVAQEIPETE